MIVIPKPNETAGCWGCGFCATTKPSFEIISIHIRGHIHEKEILTPSHHNSLDSVGKHVSRSRINSAVKSFKCEFCSASFHLEAGLVDHTRVHTG